MWQYGAVPANQRRLCTSSVWMPRVFPLVVDSDPEKAGTYVPGTGQEILFRNALKGMSVDVVIIPTQWRAKDIVAEMAREGIMPGKVLIEHGGRLIDYALEGHPYN